jgi:hypothetical protein
VIYDIFLHRDRGQKQCLIIVLVLAFNVVGVSLHLHVVIRSAIVILVQLVKN